ncbi:MAG: type II secretion system protein GspG, partial [Verrucomicrobiota bacterium]
MKAPSLSRSSAFTLMEMLLVLGIIALLIGMGAFTMNDVLGDAKDGRATGDIASISASIIRYHTYSTMYPTTGQGLQALVNRPSEGPQPKRWKSLMKPEGIIDPWGKEYNYRIPG